ncbi:MAG: 4-hydroxy-tetrahydrodipicolinate synthase [Polyangiales bacterium]
MTVPFDPRGAFTAVATPFAPDGTLDVAAFRKLVAFQVQQGITGIVPGGTTGESPTLTWDDHATMIEEAVKAADGRASVIAGTGSNNTAEAVEATRDARERGASAVLLVDCYYNGPSSLELRTEYYGRVLDSVADIPIVPYVIPGRTGCALSAEDLAILHLQDPARVSSVKEATGDLERMRRDRELAGAGLAILSGDDDMTLAMMRDGVIRSTGVISVMTNIAPGAITKMVVAQAAGDSATADAIATKLAPLFRLVTVMAKANRVLPDGRTIEVVDKFRNPVPVKTMMAGLGMLGPTMRAPLGKMTRSAVDACRSALREVQANAPELLSPIDEAFGVSVAKRLADDAIWSALARD